MEGAHLYYPRFRRSIDITVSTDNAIITSATGRYVLRYSAEGRNAISEFFDSLHEGGLTIDDLERAHPDIGNINGIIEQLDGLHLLTETTFTLHTDLISGAQLDREVRRMIYRQQRKLATSRFFVALRDGLATRMQIVGYALEYYWLVRSAPALIAPSLSTAPNLAVRQILQDFLASELNHDRFLFSALEAVGITRNLTYLQPLPATFRICASLGAYAQQHPLSFQAILFLLEQPQPEFIRAFEKRCKELELSPAFYKPLSEHSGINESADHGSISTRLLSLTPAISREEKTVVLRNAAVFLESMLQQEEEILEYYSNKDQIVPRIFD